jgi:hypothetical protein
MVLPQLIGKINLNPLVVIQLISRMFEDFLISGWLHQPKDYWIMQI